MSPAPLLARDRISKPQQKKPLSKVKLASSLKPVVPEPGKDSSRSFVPNASLKQTRTNSSLVIESKEDDGPTLKSGKHNGNFPFLE